MLPAWAAEAAAEHGLKGLERIAHGEEPSVDELVELLVDAPLPLLAAAADAAARRVKRGVGSYTVNAYIAYTNICVTGCSFCSFYRAPGMPGGYTLEPRRVAALVRALDERYGLREVHIVGGNNPELPLDYYVELLRAVRKAAPGAVVKAFTAEEIAFLSRVHGESVESILRLFMENGLQALTGGGAEILDPGVQRLIAPRKIGPEEWLRVHRTAHRLGLASNATMMYGHVEEPRHVAAHLLRLRRLALESGGRLISFIPVRFNPGGSALARTRLYRERVRESGQYDLRVVALARLALLGAVDNVVAYWVSMGWQLATAALAYGANDLGGTFYRELVITPAATMGRAKASGGVDPERLALALMEAGWRPAERDTFYRLHPPRLPRSMPSPWRRELLGAPWMAALAG